MDLQPSFRISYRDEITPARTWAKAREALRAAFPTKQVIHKQHLGWYPNERGALRVRFVAIHMGPESASQPTAASARPLSGLCDSPDYPQCRAKSQAVHYGEWPPNRSKPVVI